MQAIESLFGAAMVLLVMIATISAVVILVLAEARWIVGLSMKLYWRWRTSIDQVQHDISYDHGDKPKNRLERVSDGPSPNSDAEQRKETD